MRAALSICMIEAPTKPIGRVLHIALANANTIQSPGIGRVKRLHAGRERARCAARACSVGTARRRRQRRWRRGEGEMKVSASACACACHVRVRVRHEHRRHYRHSDSASSRSMGRLVGARRCWEDAARPRRRLALTAKRKRLTAKRFHARLERVE